jgi:HD-like signal output (HDOD) protein
MRVLEMIRGQDPDAAALSNLIHKDPGLAAHLLRTANSAAFGGRLSIVSLQQALARLGVRTVAEIALSSCVKSRLFKAPGHEERLAAIWRHALASGAFAREIARIKRRSVEGAFLCGLLHTIGKPVVIQTFADVEKTAGSAPKSTLDQVLAEFHVVFGVEVATTWKLPATVQQAIRYQDSYADAEEMSEEPRITHLASRLATALLARKGKDEVRALPVCAELDLYPDDMDAILAQSQSILDFVESQA